MTELTREQLAEIRTRDGKYSDEFMPEMVADRRALLAHIDHQAARIAELEKEIRRTRHPLLSGFVEDARVEHAAKAAWPAFKSGLEGANWAQAPQLRKDRLRIIVRTALTAALTQPEQPEAGRIAELRYRVKRALGGDLYALLTDIQNGIDAPGHKDMANSAIQRIDALLTILEGDEV